MYPTGRIWWTSLLVLIKLSPLRGQVRDFCSSKSTFYSNNDNPYHWGIFLHWPDTKKSDLLNFFFLIWKIYLKKNEAWHRLIWKILSFLNILNWTFCSSIFMVPKFEKPFKSVPKYDCKNWLEKNCDTLCLIAMTPFCTSIWTFERYRCKT